MVKRTMKAMDSKTIDLIVKCAADYIEKKVKGSYIEKSDTYSTLVDFGKHLMEIYSNNEHKTIERGYYWVKFYNHERRMILFYTGVFWEQFNHDDRIHDEIESYELVGEHSSENTVLPIHCACPKCKSKYVYYWLSDQIFECDDCNEQWQIN